jgi:ENTS family enterobactin (siderophore) exporter
VVGLAGVFMLVPTLAIGLLGGTLIDSADRRRVVLVTSTSLAIVTAVMAAWHWRRGRSPGFPRSGSCMSSPPAAFAVAPGLWPTLLALAAVGAVDGFTVALRGTIVQMVAPGEFRGRVLAADWVFAAGGTQLGSLESGALAPLTTPVISAFAGGIACSAAIVAIGVALPGLARYRLPQGLSAELRNGLRTFASDTSVDRCLAVQLAAAFSLQPRTVQPGS